MERNLVFLIFFGIFFFIAIVLTQIYNTLHYLHFSHYLQHSTRKWEESSYYICTLGTLRYYIKQSNKVFKKMLAFVDLLTSFSICSALWDNYAYFLPTYWSAVTFKRSSSNAHQHVI